MATLMTDCIFVYLTTPERADAERIGRQMVEEKLAACANIVSNMTSFYRWQGQVEEGQENILILKTRAELFGRVAARVKSLHANACPCILALPLVDGTPDYLDWIRQSTLTESGSSFN